MNMREHAYPAYQSFLHYASQAKITLLHPASRLRSLLVARLLADADKASYYYALNIDDIHLSKFLSGITHGLSRQLPSFGRCFSALPARALEEPLAHLDSVVKAFIDELAAIDRDDFYLVLDEFDRADLADDIQRFVERLSHSAPAHCHIVLNGRSLPRMPWLAMMARRHAVILRDETLVQRDFYHKPNDPNASVRALSLGPGHVFLDNRLVDWWEGHLPRLLLFFALDRPDVTRNQICQTFWTKLHIDQAVNVFHVTKRRLHKALDLDILTHRGAYYRANMETPIYFDAAEFVEAMLRGRFGEGGDRLGSWQQAAMLYRGPFLEGHDDPWILERRDAYRSAYMEALSNIADILIADDKSELALMTLSRAIETDNADDSIQLRLLRLYAAMGRRAEAVAHYRDLERRAKSQKQKLSAELRQLFSDITA